MSVRQSRNEGAWSRGRAPRASSGRPRSALAPAVARRAAPLLAIAAACALGGCKRPAVSGASGPAVINAPAPDGEHSLLRNATFEDGSSLPWLSSFSAPAKGSTDVKDGALCLTMEDKGHNAWDAQLVQRPLVIQQGHTYSVDFRAWATEPTRIRPKVGMAGPPYAEYWAAYAEIGPEPRRFQGTFTMGGADDKTAEMTFHLAGPLAKATPVTICIDDLYLSDPRFDAPPPPEVVAPPKIAVNQTGYLPKLAKVAVLESDATEPQKWQLLDGSGAVVAEGTTVPFGPDRHSGNSVHRIDFSGYKGEGKGYVLAVGDERSHPFDIDPGLFGKLKYDALAYFYHNRSGIAIEMPYAGGEQWTRPAGHLPDKVPCARDIGCDYTLDVTGGWYDAGDHGKYVVNGGFSAWMLLNQWERLEHLGRSSADFGDGKLQIPEAGNGVEDLLDEARWEVQFLMAMQAPDGTEFAGMMHHKMHDEGWTAIPTRPDQDTFRRSLRPVSTAATLNGAAVAAQAARIFEKRDRAFSQRALAVAEKAYAAAKKFPTKYADPNDNNNGGGPYEDDYVVDEFYWAAAELFITTGGEQYRADLEDNPHHQQFKQGDGTASVMNWQVTDALGVISLSVVPNELKRAERNRLRKRLVAEADRYLAHARKEGYGVPMDPGGADGKPSYPWGSNSFITTNSIVLALAYDFTKKPIYRNAVMEAMSYVLGMNPMGQSYVTGYGEKPLLNPHHRFWAKQARSDFPEAPPGVMSGGPNSALQDPYVQAAGLKKKGCAPQKCFLDNIEAWSVNEITINWNSPFAWVMAFLDEQGRKPGK